MLSSTIPILLKENRGLRLKEVDSLIDILAFIK